MASPFSTVEAFHQASDGPTEGAIYTFSHMPIVNTMALMLSVLLFVWFIAKLSQQHTAKPSRFDQSLSQLSLLVVVGLLSFVSSHHQPAGDTTTALEKSVETANKDFNRSPEFRQ